MGRPGSGKTTLAEALSADLGLTRLDIADQPGHLVQPSLAWRSLAQTMRVLGSAVVETAGTSHFERYFWNQWAAVVRIRCVAPPGVLRDRLQARVEATTEDDYVSRMLAIPEAPQAAHEWRSTEPIPGSRYNALLDALVLPIERPAMVVI